MSRHYSLAQAAGNDRRGLDLPTLGDIRKLFDRSQIRRMTIRVLEMTVPFLHGRPGSLVGVAARMPTKDERRVVAGVVHKDSRVGVLQSLLMTGVQRVIDVERTGLAEEDLEQKA